MWIYMTVSLQRLATHCHRVSFAASASGGGGAAPAGGDCLGGESGGQFCMLDSASGECDMFNDYRLCSKNLHGQGQ